MLTKINLTKGEYDRCCEYANKVSSKFKHFMDVRNTETRSENRKYNDVVRGKLAELAVKKYLDNTYGKQRVGNIDFRLYKNGETDEGDITLDSKVINIKSSKLNSHTLMIETARFRLDSRRRACKLEGKDLPNYFMFVRVNDDISDLYAEICGCITFDKFWTSKKFMPRGMCMSKYNVQNYLLHNYKLKQLEKRDNGGLLADNYGIHTDILKDIREIHNIYSINKKVC